MTKPVGCPLLFFTLAAAFITFAMVAVVAEMDVESLKVMRKMSEDAKTMEEMDHDSDEYKSEPSIDKVDWRR